MSHSLTLDNHAPLELLFHEAKLYKRHGTVYVSPTSHTNQSLPGTFFLKLVGESETSLEYKFLMFQMSALFLYESKQKMMS